MNICMLTSSYPKYPGETTAPFIEEIAAGLARRGHTVHVVAPFHRDLRRAPVERGVHLHFFRYSPVRALDVWGYAESLQADVGLRGAVYAAAPLALGAALRCMLRVTAVRTKNERPPDQSRTTNRANGSRFSLLGSGVSSFDLIHAHWVLPN